MIKKLNVLSLLLLIKFNNNIISMKVSNLANESENLEQNSAFLNLPEEIIQSIIEKLIDIDKLNNFLKKITDTENIFQLYSLNVNNFDKELLNNLNNIRLTSKDLKNSAQFYVNKLRNIFKEKKQEFINKIKEQYAHYDQNKLNSRLKNILSKYGVNRIDLEKATKLIISGADVNMKDYFGYTALIYSTEKGYKDLVKLLLNHKDINVNIQNNNGYTPLMYAVIENHKNIVELLLNYKDINLNIKDYNGYTALIWATREGNIDIVQLLLNHKFLDLNIQNNNGDTALMLAKQLGNKNILELIKTKINTD